MADNLDITPGTGRTIGTDQVGGIDYQRVKVVWGPDGTVNDADVATGKPLPVQLRSSTGTAYSSADLRQTTALVAASQFTRPADTTAYASGDLVANSTTAGSVTALQFATAARTSGGGGDVIGAKVKKSTNGVSGAAFRLHLWTIIPTFTSNGDNTALSTVVVGTAGGYLGYVDVTAMTGFSDVAVGTGAVDNARAKLPFVAVAQILYGFLEARGSYTPGNAETFDVTIMVKQD